MTEGEFHKFIVKQSVNSAYRDFIKYISLYLRLKLIIDFVKFYMFFQQQALNMSEDFPDLIVLKRICEINLKRNIFETNFRMSTTSMGVMELCSHKTELIQCWRNMKTRRLGGIKGDTLISS